MTPERQIELRRWSAGLMGWVWSEEYEIWVLDSERDADGRLTYAFPDELPWLDNDPNKLGNQTPWTPDIPTAPASQILSVIKAMELRRWWLFWNNEENVAEFYDMDSERIKRAKGNNFLEAVLEAAWATGEGLGVRG